MAHERGSSGSQSAPPEALHAILLDPVSKQLESGPTTPCLLSRLQGVDRRKGHAERGGRERGSEGLDEDRPSEGSEKCKDASVGCSVAEPSEWALEPDVSGNW